MPQTRNSQDLVEELIRRPWSRELVPDEGVVAARVPELPGCFAEGETLDEALTNLEDALESWLAAAVEAGVEIPSPKGESEPDSYSGRFSVRVPRSLHGKLALRAEVENCSLNQLVVSLLAAAVDRPQKVTSALDEVREEITADAVGDGPQSIGALKGIATHLRNRGDINLACLLYGIAGERVALGNRGAQQAAREFGTAGALARREKRMRLAEALWRESLRRDYTNIRSRSSLGQLLHHQGRYREAVEYLEPVADVDDYAKLFLGWSQLQLGLAGGDDKLIEDGLANVVGSLRRWGAYSNRSTRSAWLRQARRLWSLGPRFRPEVDQLISFASANANWPVVTVEEVQSIPAEDDGDEEAEPTSTIFEQSEVS
jgi:predicted RNase H-like HicB family nuclease